MATASQVRSAAQLERLRLATQAAQARAAAGAQARQAEGQTAVQARQAISETERQAQTARSEAQREAESRQAEIRKQRGQAEREAETAKGRARQAQRIEQRKVVLPVSKPRDLGLTSYVANVETARKQAHQAGESAKIAVTKARDEYAKQVDKWEAEALTDIDKQLTDIQAEIAKSLVQAQAEITKQQANLNSGIKAWEDKALKEIADFETKNIKLDTGEWVSRDVFNQLAPDYQGLLQKAGVDGFNTRMEAEVQDFKASHAEIQPDVWVLKAEWDSLSPTQQKEFIDTGQYSITTEIKDGKAAFAQLQSTGGIHPLAEYKGYDEETGEVSYIAPKTELPMDKIMGHWEELNDNQKQIQINGALNKNVRTKYKDFEDLAEDEKQQVLRYYVQSYLLYQTGDTQFFKDLWQEQKTQLKEAGLGMIPVYGTIRNWNKMSGTWRGISIAMDIACVLPFITAAARAIKGIGTPLQVQASTLAKAELAASKDMAKTLSRAYAEAGKLPGVTINNRGLAKSYTNMVKAQGNFTKQLARVADITAKGGNVSAKLKLAVSKAELNLRGKATTFVDKLNMANSSIKGIKNIPVRFDSAEVKALMRSLPNEMVQNSKAAIRALEVKPGNVKGLTRAVVNAGRALKAAQANHPTDPSKWVDLMYNLTKAEGKLAQAKAGSVTEIYKELLKARSKGQTAKAAQLEKDLARALNSMDAEWGQLGRSSGGKVAIDTRTKPWLPTTGTEPALGRPTATGISAEAGIAAIVINAGLENWDESKGVSTPEVIEAAREIAKTLPKIEGVTTPEVVAITKAALEESLKAALEGLTDNEIEVRALDATKSITKTYVDQKIMTQTEAKTIATTAAKVATKVATATAEMKINKKLTTKRPDDKDGEKDRQKYPDGTIVWKMGETKRGEEYKIIPPPYTMLKPISSRYPPKGMTKTKGTPQETLTFIGGKVPFGNVSFDLGVTDGFIDVKARKIEFTGGGQKTDVGTRIISTTKGVSLANNKILRGQLTRPRIESVSAKPRRGRIVSHGVYADKGSRRITRKRRRGWKRIY